MKTTRPRALKSVREPKEHWSQGSKASKGLRENSWGRGASSDGECKGNESSAGESSVTFRRSFWKVAEMDAEQEGMPSGGMAVAAATSFETGTKATGEVTWGWERGRTSRV